MLFHKCLYAAKTSTHLTFESTNFRQTVIRFNTIFWSPARQLQIVLLVAPRGCWHQIVDNVEVSKLQSVFNSLVYPASLVVSNKHLVSGTMMVYLIPTPPSGSFSETRLRNPIQIYRNTVIRFRYGRCSHFFFQYKSQFNLLTGNASYR